EISQPKTIKYMKSLILFCVLLLAAIGLRAQPRLKPLSNGVPSMVLGSVCDGKDYYVVTNAYRQKTFEPDSFLLSKWDGAKWTTYPKFAGERYRDPYSDGTLN